MGRRYIKDLGEREDIDDVFIASEKQLRPNRNGNLYLQMRLTDRTGTVNAMMWNVDESIGREFESGDYVHVRGRSQIYNGNLQIIVSHIERAEPGSINEDDFQRMTTARKEGLLGRLAEQLRSIEDPWLRDLAECFLTDDSLMDRFAEAPAGVKHHHAYPGGLLEHVVQLIDLVLSVVPHYESELNRDLLLMGAFVHDIGKIDELTYERGLGYSDEGQLVGHLVQGVVIVHDKIGQVEQLRGEDFPAGLSAQLKHMIVSHHGRLEFGSPKVPMTLEAIVLHYLDDMDAKLYSFAQLMRDDVDASSRWTTYHPHLGRKILKSDSVT